MSISISVEIGDCFHIPDSYRRNKRHLCVCVTKRKESPPQVMLVPLVTKRDWSDTTVVLQPGIHPFVKKPTVVDFRFARVEPISKLEEGIEKGRIRRDQPFPSQKMVDIRNGVTLSAFTPNCMIDLFNEMDKPECDKDLD